MPAAGWSGSVKETYKLVPDETVNGGIKALL